MPLETSKREAKRKRIFTAAVKVMGEQGYRDATVRAITNEAGVANGIFYYYFESKSDLVRKMLKAGTGRLFRAYERAMEPGMSTVQMFHAIALASYDEALKNPEFIKFIFSEMWRQDDSWRPLLSDEVNEVIAVFAEIIEKGQEEGIFDPALDASITARMVFSTVCTTAASCREGHFGDNSMCAGHGTEEQVVKFVYRGLACQNCQDDNQCRMAS